MQFYSTLRETPAVYSVVRCLITFAIIGPPCILMGATLPLLVRCRIASDDLAVASARLYGVNTLGAAAGAYTVGFQLLPGIGVTQTNIVTAFTNCVVGLLAIITARSVYIKARCSPTDASANQSSPLQWPSHELLSTSAVPPTYVIYAIAVVTGCAALILQTVWSRQLSLILGSSTYSFSAMLVVILVGIGCGSLLFEHLPFRRRDASVILANVVTCLAAASLLGFLGLPFAADFAAVAVPLRAHFGVNAFVCVAASALVEFLPAMAMGVLFPILVHLSVISKRDSVGAVGSVYAANTAGTVFGALLASTWLVPAVGTRTSLLVAVGLYLLIGQLCALISVPTRKLIILQSVAGALIGLVLVQADDPRRINMGQFLYGYRSLDQINDEVLWFKEGMACNVLVTKNAGAVSFRVNGKIDGGTSVDLSMQAGLAYLPRFFNPDAKNVLVIGYGTGTTSGASLLFPNTRVTCCEIEPAIVSASHFFSQINHSAESSKQLKIVYDDARAFVQGSRERFDIILSEPSNPWIAGVANLFTAEFYKSASAKLNSHGIFAQWIQTYSFTPDDYAMIVQTICEVFPHQRLIRISSGDTILLASNDSFNRDAAAMERCQKLVDSLPVVKSDLVRDFSTSDIVRIILTRTILDEGGLRTFVDTYGDKRRNMDCDLQLEFRAARHLYEVRQSKVARAILGATDPAFLIEHFERLRGANPEASLLNDLIMLYSGFSNDKIVSELLKYGLTKQPGAPELIASYLISMKEIDSAWLDQLATSDSESIAFHLNRVGVAYWNRKQYAEAVKVFRRMCDRFPQSATSWANLAINCKLSDMQEASEEARRHAVELDAVNPVIPRQ
ncbi:fused MFS/spermidine synthase [Schlesneria paludicola]|uniref:fused MFS/spermidine synthase n=1 Tax=Schlesneria paludicola TaxID=360056 RepID=UPI0012F7ADED|nr:fused MFS/spermidine synthase [Schlesneria paludicola]